MARLEADTDTDAGQDLQDISHASGGITKQMNKLGRYVKHPETETDRLNEDEKKVEPQGAGRAMPESEEQLAKDGMR